MTLVSRTDDQITYRYEHKCPYFGKIRTVFVRYHLVGSGLNRAWERAQ